METTRLKEKNQKKKPISGMVRVVSHQNLGSSTAPVPKVAKDIIGCSTEGK